MERPDQWDLPEEVQALREWLTPERTALLRDKPRLELEELLNKHDPHTISYISICLDHLGLWESQAGAYAVLEGDEAGWTHLRLALEYKGWHLRIEYAEYEQDVAEGRPTDIFWEHGLAARCLAQTIVFRDDALADWCGGRMLAGANYSHGFFRAWDHTPFHPFMARLYALWRGRAIKTDKGPLRNLGVYQPLLDGWKDDRAYAAALFQACDYHCVRTFCGDDEDTEFWRPPFHVFPAEILAVQRVRKELVGSAPRISHPLLDTPLGRVPCSIPLPPDELLARVIARVQRDLPGVC